MPSNYPADVTDAHPYFNPPAEIECPKCDHPVMPGEECEDCHEIAPTEDELREEAELEKADAEYDALREDNLDHWDY